jgi:hypothetical protein
VKRPVETYGRRATARRILAMLVIAQLLAASAPAEEPASISDEGGIGAGAALVTLVYAPLKLAYAAGGIVLAGVTWLWTFGDSDVARTVARASTNGDYVVTPSHLRRDSDLDFDGDS